MKLTHKSLAKLFVTTQATIVGYINRKAFTPEDMTSICDFYWRNGKAINKRYEKWQLLYKAYNEYFVLSLAERSYVEKMLKEWGEGDKIKKD